MLCLCGRHVRWPKPRPHFSPNPTCMHIRTQIPGPPHPHTHTLSTPPPLPCRPQEDRGKKRLQFLLKQAEVFQHFAPAASKEGQKKRRGRHGGYTEEQEDEGEWGALFPCLCLSTVSMFHRGGLLAGTAGTRGSRRTRAGGRLLLSFRLRVHVPGCINELWMSQGAAWRVHGGAGGRGWVSSLELLCFLL